MGLQNQFSDVSSESTLVLLAVLAGKSVRYLRSLILTILHALGRTRRSRLDNPLCDGVVGSGLAGVIFLCEQLNLNRSYPVQSGGGDDRFGFDCVVCLNRIDDGDRVRRLACRHVFHGGCIDGWLGHLNFSCPMCRAPLVSDERLECARRRVAGDLVAWFSVQ